MGEAEQALTSCNHNCDCPVGFYCNSSTGFCSNVQFGPPPPQPYCYDSCQCAWPETCVEFHPGFTLAMTATTPERTATTMPRRS